MNIIGVKFNSFPGHRLAGISAVVFFTLSCTGLAADAVTLVKTPELSPKKRGEFPLNVARANIGASIRSSKLIPSIQQLTNGEIALSADSLISNDETLSYPLSEGNTSFVVSLPFICATNEFTFFKDGPAQGSVVVSVSSQPSDFKSSKWREVGRQTVSAGPRSVNVQFQMTEGMAVKVDFQVDKPCHVSAFGLFGDRLNTGLKGGPKVGKDPLPLSQTAYYNYADIASSQASVCYISSGAGQANSILDDNPATSLEFASDDSSPVAIVDLGAKQSIQRVSMLYQATRRGKIEVYLFDELPEAWAPAGTKMADSPAKLVIPASFFSSAKPRSSVKVDPAEGKTALPFDLCGSRYLMVHWTFAPLENVKAQAAIHRDWVVSPYASLLFAPLAQTSIPGGPSIMECNVFGNTYRSHFGINPTPVQNLQQFMKYSKGSSPNPPNTGLPNSQAASP